MIPEDVVVKGEIPDEPRKIFSISELVGSSNVMFAATGVSHSDFVEGVIFRPGGAITNSVVFRGKSGTIRYL